MNYLLKKHPIFLLIFISCVFYTCANMVVPNGGAKDVKAPVVKKSTPKSKSTNFQSDQIEIEFDEYIVLKDIQNQFIMSPGNKKTEINKKGKKLEVKFIDGLDSNTTYILNFGNGISDYTENNIYKDFKFIFSTGAEIDTLTLNGKLIDAFTKEAQKDVLICLYTDINNDSVFMKQKPNYTVRTKENGEYVFTNLKKNTYKIFALKESNNNKYYDSNDEQIAFYESFINLDSNTRLNDLKLFNEIPSKLKVLNKDNQYQKTVLAFNKKNTSYTITDKFNNIDTLIYSKNIDTCTIYYKEKRDTNLVYIQHVNGIETLNLKLSKSIKKKGFNLVIHNEIVNDTCTVYSNDLFEINRKDSVLLYEDSIPVSYTLKKTEFDKYYLIYPFNKLKKYELVIKDSAFVDYQNQVNAKMKQLLKFYEAEDYGTLKLVMEIGAENKIVELLNDKNITVRKSIFTKDGTVYYTKLNPGQYRIRVINDVNSNAYWDTGNLLKKIQAEEVYYYTNPIKIRANWDAEVILK